MKSRILLPGIVLSFALANVGCSGGASTNTSTNTSTSSTKPAATKSTGKKDMKVAKQGEKKEGQKALPDNKKVAVPADWVTMFDDEKGYEFQVPDGTQGDWQTVEGVDVFVAVLPDPAKVSSIVIAFKNKKLSKDDLLEATKRFLASMGEKDIKIGTVESISDDYDLTEVTSVDEKGMTTKAKLLLATDVSDNYIVLVGSPESSYKANESVIDQVWGSFSMYSGGASGKS